MSGGRFDYADSRAQSEIFGYDSYDNGPRNVFEDREVSELVWDMFELIHDFDWYKSGDTSEETYLKKKAAFKKKWLGTTRSARIRQTIDAAIEDTRRELYKTYGVKVGENGAD